MRIDFKYVAKDRDRHGNVRLYVRLKGVKVRLRASPDSLEFAEEYYAALKAIKARLNEVEEPLRGDN